METQIQNPTPASPPLPETKQYYCKSSHYQACINPGQSLVSNGTVTRIGEKHVAFTPCVQAQGISIGVLSTDDPEVQAFLERELARGNPDFLDPQMFKEFITPAEQRVAEARGEAAKWQRELEMQNTLIADLATANPELYAKLVKQQKRR